jgi:hypothetical protein
MMRSVNESFVAALQDREIDPSLLPHAMRYFVGAWSEDLSPEQMRDRLISAGVDTAEISRAQELLAEDVSLMEDAALAILQAGWEEPSSRAAVEGAFGAASAKLPVVEAALIAIVAVYGMWLAATKGRRSQHTVIRRKGDGSWEEEQSIEWYGPSGPLRAIAGLFGAPVDVSSEDENPELPDAERRELPHPDSYD